MRFSEYQAKAHETATTGDVEIYSLGLIGEAGSVASAIKKFKRDAPSEKAKRRDIEEEIGDALWYLAEIATRFDLDLDAIATANLGKTQFLFRGHGEQYDEPFPTGERFPRRVEVTFNDKGQRVQIQVDGNPIGDPLTDNANRDDGYRFHDAFHLAYMTVLGWSPVMRRLLGCKRKSNPRVDEVEDGARARALEEGISIMLFSQSSTPDQRAASLFSDRGQIHFWLLEVIKKMTVDLEVRTRSVIEWSSAIAAGFQVFDQFRQNGGGTVLCDLDTKRLTVRLG